MTRRRWYRTCLHKNERAGPLVAGDHAAHREARMHQQDHRFEEYASAAFSVRQGLAIVARHRATIARLQRDGHDTDAARRRLKQLVASLQMYEEDCKRLEGELENAD